MTFEYRIGTNKKEFRFKWKKAFIYVNPILLLSIQMIE